MKQSRSKSPNIKETDNIRENFNKVVNKNPENIKPAKDFVNNQNSKSNTLKNKANSTIKNANSLNILRESGFFNFDFFVHVFNYFTPARINEKIDDVTYGRENVPVSCINSVDNSYPEYLDYSKVRLPQKNVEIPLDEGFLTCCDCDDGCQVW